MGMIDSKNLTRRTFLGAAGALCASGAAAVLLGGCSDDEPREGDVMDGDGMVYAPPVVVGTLATEDILPLWVAQENGLFEYPFAPEIVIFQSANELMTAVASGQVDIVMTDIMVAASMFAAGTHVKLEWVTLGETPDQGRFGIMVGPDSAVQTLNDLAGVPIGVGSNTILEYVMDCLMAEAGVPDDQVLVEEIKKLPLRYQAMQSGQVAAAALPGSLLALGEAQGCRVVADDTHGRNISQSVMASREEFAETQDGEYGIELLRDGWNAAAALVSADPSAYRDVLVRNANLAAEVADTYPVCTYPQAALPTAEMVEPVLEWMAGKGYLSVPLEYDPATGMFAAE